MWPQVVLGFAPEARNRMIFWLRGKDLNLRPLGYEFNTSFWMDSAIAKNQSHAVSMYWLILIVRRSPVSNLLAIFDLSRHILMLIIAARALSVSTPRPPSSSRIRYRFPSGKGALRAKMQAGKAPPRTAA